jgi:hypothetical protein
MLVGDAMSSKALCIVGYGNLQRCSLLTPQQLQPVTGVPTEPGRAGPADPAPLTRPF